ncbi:hypothetical protein EMCRGX_G020542 [Ephydatia muelleri]
MEVLDASDGELAPHTDDDVQESERIGEVGENESETSVCMGVDDFCSDGGRSSGCMDARGGERDAGGDGGSSDGDDSDRGDGDSSDCSQDWGTCSSNGDESDRGDRCTSDGDMCSCDGNESDSGDSGDGGVAKVSNVLNVFLTKGGCCKHSCLMKYHDLAQIRAHSLAALNKKTRKAVVLGMLALVQDNLVLEMYTIIALTAMEAGMCSGSDIVPNAHGNSGRAPHHALSQLDKLTVVKFIKNYAAVHALPDPGRLQGKTRDFVLGGIKHSLENEGQVALPVSMYEVRGDHIYSVDAPQKARLSLARGEAGLFACMNFFVMEGCTPLSKDHITNLLVMAGGKIVSNPQVC